ncbi:homocysteine biosynthesis protein [Candidatus Aerophobetes bacterium]|nr:homocysteine biosynthesis protein [Candidatus Aerophobetes bacterium]
MAKTIAQINEKIRKGKAVVVTAEEIIDIAQEEGVKKAAEKVDVVTTATFGPMCSSGAYINIGHTRPRIKLGGGKVYLNGIPAYAGFAAVDLFIGAAALPDDDPRNRVYPGEFRYGGGHLIEDLVAGRDVKLVVTTYGTDCYPRTGLETWININDLNEAVLFNMRNAYQNYNVAVNLSDRVIYTYMGVLRPHLGNATYSTCGQLSPLMNDPYYEVIGIGTKIFLGGGVGFITWQGTQHNPNVPRTERGIPKEEAGTIAVIGDLKKMSPEYLKGTSMTGYGATLSVGIGVPIPILDEKILYYTTVKNEDIYTQIVDYSKDYPQLLSSTLGEVTYAELATGKIIVQGREVPTGCLSSYWKARKIAATLKEWISEGKFLLTEPVAPLPSINSGISLKPLRERPLKRNSGESREK